MMTDSEDPYISPGDDNPYHRTPVFNNINGSISAATRGGGRGGHWLFYH